VDVSEPSEPANAPSRPLLYPNNFNSSRRLVLPQKLSLTKVVIHFFAVQPCLWCYHHILEEATKENLPARCPNCRSEYDQNKISMQHIDAEQLEEEKRKLKEKDKPKGVGGVTSRIPRAALTNVRVVQPNLVYAVGISMEICHEDTLKDAEFFGQFGKTVKISVNRSNQYASAMARHGPTGSAYVTFKRAEDALRCIKMIDGNLWRGKPVKACFGTTKYCNAFLKGVTCNNPDCLYLHELADDADCLTKEEVAAGLLPARFLAMGATNTFKPRLTINLIPNAQTAAAQAAAAAAAAAGQNSAAIQAAAAAAGGISRHVPPPPGSTSAGGIVGASGPHPYQQQQQQQFSQQQMGPPPPPLSTAPRVLTIPASGRTSSHGSLHHQDSRHSGDYGVGSGGAYNTTGGSSSSGGYNGSNYGGNYGGEMDSPGRGYSGYQAYHAHHHHHHAHHHNEFDTSQEHHYPGPSPPRGLWASAAAAGAAAPPPSAMQPPNAVPPPPPSDKQEWPTLAAAPSNASSATITITTTATTAAGEGGSAPSEGSSSALGRMPSMAEQLARTHSNPGEAKTARQPKKLLPLSSPGKTLKTLGKAVPLVQQQQPRAASPVDSQFYPRGNANSNGGVGAIGQGIVELNLGTPATSIASSGLLGASSITDPLDTVPKRPAPSAGASAGAAAAAAPRGPPPGFGSGGGLASHPLQSSGSTAPPPGFSRGATASSIGGTIGSTTTYASGHSSFDSLGNLHHQQLRGVDPSSGGLSNGNGPSTYSPFTGGSFLFDPASTYSLSGGSGSGGAAGGSQRQRSRFAFANAEEEAANNEQQQRQHAMGTNFSSLIMPQQAQQQQQQQQPHHGSPSPQDASAFFKSLFPTANINIANAPTPEPSLGGEGAPPPPPPPPQRLGGPPGFNTGDVSGALGIGMSSSMARVQQQHGYNPVSSMFPSAAAADDGADDGGDKKGCDSIGPGLALLRQLQGSSVSPHGSTGGGGSSGGGGAQQPPPGFGMRM
jgi:hypothetical protein